MDLLARNILIQSQSLGCIVLCGRHARDRPVEYIGGLLGFQSVVLST